MPDEALIRQQQEALMETWLQEKTGVPKTPTPKPPRIHANTRKTHCPYGHPLDGVKTVTDRRFRFCKTCARERYYRKTAGKARRRANKDENELNIERKLS